MIRRLILSLLLFAGLAHADPSAPVIASITPVHLDARARQVVQPTAPEIRLAKGTDATIALTVRNSDNTRTNIDGAVMILTVRKTLADTTPAISRVAAITDASNGLATFAIAQSDTSSLALGDYLYSVETTWVGGAREQLVKMTTLRIVASVGSPSDVPTTPTPEAITGYGLPVCNAAAVGKFLRCADDEPVTFGWSVPAGGGGGGGGGLNSLTCQSPLVCGVDLVDVTMAITSPYPVNKGGTNATAGGVTGAFAYWAGTSYGFTNACGPNTVPHGNGAAAPTCGAIVASDMAAGAAATNVGAGGVSASMLASGACLANIGAQSGNKVLASPANGTSAVMAPRALVSADIPDLTGSYQPLDTDLTAISALVGTPGMVARTGAGTFAVRTLGCSDSACSWTDGNGAGGAPTLTIANPVPAPGAAGGLLYSDGGAWTRMGACSTSQFLKGGGAASPSCATLGVADISDIAATYQPLDADLTAIAAASCAGVWVRTASNTWTCRTITGTTVTVTNGDGVSGAPAISIADGAIGNAKLANPATTVNGQACTLGSTCTVPAYATIQNGGSGLTQRTTFNCSTGLTCSDNSGASRTDVAVSYGISNSTACVGNDSRLLPAPSAAGKVCYDTGAAYACIAAGSSGQCLKSGGAAAPTWGPCSAGGADASSLQGVAVSAAAPSDKDVLCYVSANTDWEPCATVSCSAHQFIYGQGSASATCSSAPTNGQIPIGSTGADPVLAALTNGGGITATSGAGSITLGSSGGGDVSGALSALTVAKINGVPLGSTTATDKNILIAEGTNWVTRAMSGDITIGNTGVTAIGALKVVNAMIAAATIDLTAKVTGVLPIANGGTNATAIGAAGSIPYSSSGTSQGYSNAFAAGAIWLSGGSAAPSALVDVATGQVLVSGGVATNPAYSATPTVTTLTGSTSLLTPLLDAVAAGALNLGTTTATSIVLKQNTSLPTGKTFTLGSNVLAGSVTDKLNAAMLAIASQAVGDVLYADTTTTFARLAAAVTAGYALMSNGGSTAPSWQQPGVVADGVVANGGTTINANADTTIYTVPTAPTNKTIFVCTGVTGRISQAGIASSGTPTHTLSVGKTAGGQGFLANQTVLIAAVVNTKFGFTLSTLGSEFIALDGYNAYLSAGDNIIVRYAIANSGGISTQIVTRWTVTGYWI